MFNNIRLILENMQKYESDKALILLGISYGLLLKNEISNTEFSILSHKIRKYLENEGWFEICYYEPYEIKVLNEIIEDLKDCHTLFSE